MKYVIVDVYALAYRGLYGYPHLTNKKGESTSVIVGFFKQFFAQVADTETYYPIFVADTHNTTYRTELYPEYKGTRSKQEDSFYTQIDQICEVGRHIGTVYRMDGYEADDLAACFINTYVKPEDTCLLLTVDQDWLQLLNRNVEVIQLKPNHNHVHWTDESFFKEWGFAPKQLVDYKAIVGDTSDNIPGVKGIGPKTATELIKDFSDVDNMYKNIVRIPNTRKMQTHLIESEELVRRNRKLVTLNSSVTNLPAPNTIITQDVINTVIDMYEAWTDAVEILNILGLYLQRRTVG